MSMKCRVAAIRMRLFIGGRVGTLLAGLYLALAHVPAAAQGPAAPGARPVLIGLDEAYSIATSTSPKAIERGIRAAINEINARGGVLGGRPLQLVTTDNQGVSARGRDNYIDLAGRPGIAAVFTGKFSPITVETVPEANRLKVPLVSVWGSADQITESVAAPSYVFRLSLKDSWGVEAMMQRAKLSHKASRLCALLPNTAWGRSSEKVLNSRAASIGLSIAALRWYNWGDTEFADHLASCRRASAQVLLMVANERLPIIAHWGLTGGVLHELAGDSLDKVDMQVIQTFTFFDNKRPAAQRLADALMKELGVSSVREIPSPVGSAHAYDMTHLLALAINKAQSTDGQAVRQALENLPPHEGAVRRYNPAFSASRHEALTPSEVLFVRMTASGHLVPVR